MTWTFGRVREREIKAFRAVFLAISGLLAGCAGSGNPDHFYMLQAAQVVQSAPAASDGPLVGIGPVRIPSYLERSQIVAAVSGQEYRFSDDHRWAERLDVTLARVTAQNLARLIPTERVVMYPWPRESKPDVQIVLTLQEMRADAAGEVKLEALWTLRSGKDQVINRHFLCRQPASAVDYDQVVQVESQCLANLNRDMATEINALGKSR